jgi:filamentous hemagglutinin family protein
MSSLIAASQVSAAVIGNGLGTIVGPGSNYTINGGTQVGSNLFYSFSQFNLTNAETATFNSAGITNIISRITGGPSSINGRIVSGANLFLLNPAGIMFGPNATLNITGSFHATTADYLKLGTNGIFYADPAMASTLTVDPPSAFGFLKTSPASISANESLLEVPAGKNISLVSGGIDLTSANLVAPGGTINLVSVASPGLVTYNGVSMTPQGFSSLGSISITEGVRTVNPPTGLGNLDASGTGGGNIYIRGGSFYMSGATIYNDTYGNTAPGVIDIAATGNTSIAGSSITGNAMNGTASGASIAIIATNMMITDTSLINTDSFTSAKGADISLKASNSVTIDGTGTSVLVDAHNKASKAGNLVIEAPIVTIGNDTTVSSSAPVLNGLVTYGAGTVTINASQSLTLLGSIRSDTVSGSAGAITINTGELNISGTGKISTTLQANPSLTPRTSGDITINAGNINMSGDGRIESRALPYYVNGVNVSRGGSGIININAANLSLLERSAISTSIGTISGVGGHINVTATGNILVSSNPVQQLNGTGSFASDSTNSDAGHIRMEANNITINNGAMLSTVALGPTGKGGDITLIAHGTLTVEGAGPEGSIANPSSVQADTLGGGAAGTISLAAPQIIVSNGGLISSASLPGSTGAAGNIAIAVSDMLKLNTGTISTQSAVSQGGNISISAPGIMSVVNGDITASVKGGLGNGGNVTIDSGYLALNNGRITAQAEWGSGGNLLITASNMFVNSIDSVLSASSRYGQQGTVVVNSPNTDVAGALAAPVFDILNMNAFIPKRCIIADDFNASTFRLLGSDGLPASPENSFPIL